MKEYDVEKLIEEAVECFNRSLARSIKQIIANKPVAKFVLGVATDWGAQIYSTDDKEGGRAYTVYGLSGSIIYLEVTLGPDDNVGDIKPVIAAFAGNPDFKRVEDLAVDEYGTLRTQYKHEEAGCTVRVEIKLNRSSHCTVEIEQVPTGEMVEAHERIDYRKVVVCRDDEGNVISRNNGGGDESTRNPTDKPSDSESPVA